MSNDAGRGRVDRRAWGQTSRGESVHGFVLSSPTGVQVELIELGATLASLRLPVGDEVREVVLGCDTIADYEAQSAALGAVVGRCANRTGQGRLELDGVTHQLELNHGEHHLHGGARGFGQRVWAGQRRDDPRGPSVRFSRTAPAGEGGYPGTLEVRVDYTLGADARLCIEYWAVTDQLTAVNLTNHAYFNLGGEDLLDCRDHVVTVHADRFIETDAEQIPTGRLLSVGGTPLDLQGATRLAEGLASEHPAITDVGGYDHAFVFAEGRELDREVARVVAPDGRLAMTLWTDQPCVQLYTGNFLAGTPARGGRQYGAHAGLALEAQGLVDATKHAHFPTTLLRPGEVYEQQTVLGFECPRGS